MRSSPLSCVPVRFRAFESAFVRSSPFESAFVRLRERLACNVFRGPTLSRTMLRGPTKADRGSRFATSAVRRTMLRDSALHGARPVVVGPHEQTSRTSGSRRRYARPATHRSSDRHTVRDKISAFEIRDPPNLQWPLCTANRTRLGTSFAWIRCNGAPWERQGQDLESFRSYWKNWGGSLAILAR